MKIKDLFTISLRIILADLIIFLVGVFLSYGFMTVCRTTGGICPQPTLFYVGLILILFSIIHFIINLIVSKKFVLAIIAIIILSGCAYYFINTLKIERPFYNSPQTNAVKFRLLDGDTGNPISSQEIYVCDDSVKIDYVGEYPLARFCDGEHRKIITKTTTDSSGIFSLDVKKINVKPAYSIVIDTGKSDDRWGKVEIERSDGLGHTFNPSYLRVLNAEKDGHIISNKFYNLDTKEVKEVFTNGDPEKTYAFDVINLTVFGLPKN